MKSGGAKNGNIYSECIGAMLGVNHEEYMGGT